MATRSTFYLDGLNLSSSRSVYSDEQLTTLASDGWYSDGLIARQQVSGLLQAVEQCDNCGDPPPPPETIYVASIRLVNGDCFTGNSSDSFDSKIFVESNWSKFTNISGFLKVQNGTSIIGIDTQTYNPNDANVEIVANSLDQSAGTLAGNGTYLVNVDSLQNPTPDVRVEVNLSLEASFETCEL